MCEIKDREQSPFRPTRPHERPDEGRDRSHPSGYACLDNGKSKNPLKFAMNKKGGSHRPTLQVIEMQMFSMKAVFPK